MRMWMIKPEFMCKNHLLGEHNEIHKFRHVFVKQYKITGRIIPKVQIEPKSMKKRHDQIVKEMLRRGYNHNSPYEMPDLSHLSEEFLNAKVDKVESKKELKCRCEKCKRFMQDYKGVKK